MSFESTAARGQTVLHTATTLSALLDVSDFSPDVSTAHVGHILEGRGF